MNYLKIAFRNLIRFRGYTLINMLGLTLGLVACLLIFRYIGDEWSVDQHHLDKENIYRISSESSLRNERSEGGRTPSPLAKALQADFPEIEASARICQVFDVEKFLVNYNNQAYFEERVVFADSNFFELLTYEFLQGDRNTALDQPFSVVLSSAMAKKLFGKDNPIGETIEISSHYGGQKDYQVTGVLNDQKYRSHIEGDFFISARSGAIGKAYFDLQEWAGLNLFYTYVRLRPETNVAALTAALPNWLEGYAGDRFREFGIQRTYSFTPISDVYLKAAGANIFGPKGNDTLLYILAGIATFILLIACINFMNLATAKASLRTKEVGIRKAVGADRSMLIQQFMSEAFLYAFLAVVLGCFSAELLLPTFSALFGQSFTDTSLLKWEVVPWLLGFVFVTTLVAGTYPAFYLSSFSPATIFKNSTGPKGNTRNVRRTLVAIQFIISIGLIQGVLVMQQQMDFIQNKSLGFNPEAKIVLSLNTDEANQNYSTLRNTLLENGQVEEVGAASGYPGEPNGGTFFYYKDGQMPDEGFLCVNSTVTPEFMQVMDFELVTGRLFDPNRFADTTTKAVITEKTMHGLGMTADNVLGQTIYINFEQGEQPGFEIIGVIKDYHDVSLHQEMQGQVFDWSPQWPTPYVVASVKTENVSSLLADMEQSWQRVNPNEPFEFQFLEDRLQQNYEADQRLSQLIVWGTLLTIFISCLGLFGLITFAAERRGKEISIRKVLGASVPSIVALLSRDFIQLVLLALLAAAPISWYVMQQWLDGFAYHIDVTYWTVVVAGLFAVLITLLTIGFQSVKAATVNPIQSLKRE
ncbi:MAG: ABC transporter permease [Bacteroidota bacterium]